MAPLRRRVLQHLRDRMAGVPLYFATVARLLALSRNTSLRTVVAARPAASS